MGRTDKRYCMLNARDISEVLLGAVSTVVPKDCLTMRTLISSTLVCEPFVRFREWFL